MNNLLIKDNWLSSQFNKNVYGLKINNVSKNDLLNCLNKLNLEKKKQSVFVFSKVPTHLINICQILARKIIEDGEGATKIVDISITNAKNNAEAKGIALTLANSSLIKTAFYGSDPNWGRILVKLGSMNDATYNIQKIVLKLNGQTVFKHGAPVKKIDYNMLNKRMKKKNIKVFLNLSSGKASYNLVTSDLSKKYVDLNSKYST